ncbi:S9 family peptidase [Streptomyces kaniharaensis]|uniref:S9 family peptidase n=1 Tax=Streptomyces kaniharaensis TaxID=212423 RepID=UPI002DDD41DE|nr:prolyl oligopeptidase family serine peptidase [Streptomyces kaniharaensis]
MTITDPFLSLSARTGRFTYGAPRAAGLSEDGTRLLLLRSTGPEDPVDRLHLLDTATDHERLIADPAVLVPGRTGHRDDLPTVERRLRERTRLVAAGIGTYAATADLAVAVLTLDGRLFRADTATGSCTELPTAGPAFDPRPDATGRRVAYVCDDALYVTPDKAPLSPADGARWGVAEFAAAEELGRSRGHWWRPDGGALLAARVDESALPRRYFADPASPGEPAEDFAYPQAGGPNADVQLWVLGLDRTRVRLRWDDAAFPYVCAASWAGDDEILLTVADRLQQNVLLLSAYPATGETRELSRTTDEFWVDDLPGTPARLTDGRLLTAHDTPEARGLALDGKPLDTTGLQIRRVVGRLRGRLLCETTEGDPADQHVHLVDPDGGAPVRISDGPGTHSALAAADTLLLTSADADGTRRRLVLADGRELPLADLSAALPYRVVPQLARVTELGLPTAVVYPRDHVPGRRLPVLLDVYGGPGFQAVASEPRRWQLRQWWADQGFAVVTTDNRGTPFVSPDFARAIFRRFSRVAVDDQVTALHALAERHPDLDLGRVGVRGWSYGGYFAALAVLRRPDVFHAGSAGAPPTDFRQYDTAYTERYLGLPQDNPEGYAGDCLIDDAPSLTRPLLLVHGLADDNVHPSHTLLLSQALTRTGRPHRVLPLPGVTHMTPGGVNEQVAQAELAFLREALGLTD